ncbi:MAG: hypothetical protein AB7W59_29305 [Acidimicrobiia bacterium]
MVLTIGWVLIVPVADPPLGRLSVSGLMVLTVGWISGVPKAEPPSEEVTTQVARMSGRTINTRNRAGLPAPGRGRVRAQPRVRGPRTSPMFDLAVVLM